VEVNLAPLTAAARGVALWLGLTVVVIAVLTAGKIMRPAFVNEPQVTAAAFLLGALVGAVGVWKREPLAGALSWVGADIGLALCVLAFPSALGLAA